MQKIIQFKHQIPVEYKVDICVAGGGPAGLAAAIAARRSGAKVFLLESLGAFGGMGTLGMVPAFMMFGDQVNFLAGGIVDQVLSQYFVNAGIPCDDIRKKCINGFIYDIELLKLTYDQLLEEADVNFLLFTTVIASETKNGRLKHVICASKSELFAIEAECFIDATGDGDLAFLSGAEYLYGEEVQPGTLCSIWNGVNCDTVDNNIHHPFSKYVLQAYKDGVLSEPDLHLPGFWRYQNALAGGNIGHLFGIDNTNVRSRTRGMIQGRKQLQEYQNYFRRYFKELEKVELVTSASIPGIRESRRIRCDYTLTGDDFVKRASFPDEIGRYCYPIDMHRNDTSNAAHQEFEAEFKQKYRYQAGESYGIPYRSLLVKGFDNLLVAGRCIDTDRLMLASLRVMPGCFITGQAAGVAAGIMVTQKLNSTREISGLMLKEKLTELGACV